MSYERKNTEANEFSEQTVFSIGYEVHEDQFVDPRLIERRAATVATANEHVGNSVDSVDTASRSLISLDRVRPPPELPTGIDVFDNFLIWRGLPKGDLTLLSGKPGTGGTSLWVNTVRKIHQEKKWVAWINSDWELLPANLVQKKIDLQRLLIVKKPKEASQMFWILKELISSSLFEMVGCHLQEGGLKNHQLRKLKKLAALHQVALIVICQATQWVLNPLFSLVIECQRDFFTIKRALYRPTPFTISSSMIHTDFLSQVDFSPTALLG